MPSTPFIGVRISWLMLARNCDLSRDASMAWSRATRMAVSTSRRSRDVPKHDHRARHLVVVEDGRGGEGDR